MHTSTLWIRAAVLGLGVACLGLSAQVLAADLTLRERFDRDDEASKMDALVQELRSLPVQDQDAFTRYLDERVEQQSKIPQPHGYIMWKSAYVLRAIGDEKLIVQAFSGRIARMDIGDQVDAAFGLSYCKSDVAAKSIHGALKARFDSWGALTDGQSSADLESFSKTAGKTVRLMSYLASTAPPEGRRLASELRAELKRRSATSQIWKTYLAALDSKVKLEPAPSASESSGGAGSLKGADKPVKADPGVIEGQGAR